jgi:hypothetical protein
MRDSFRHAEGHKRKRPPSGGLNYTSDSSPATHNQLANQGFHAGNAIR